MPPSASASSSTTRRNTRAAAATCGPARSWLGTLHHSNLILDRLDALDLRGGGGGAVALAGGGGGAPQGDGAVVGGDIDAGGLDLRLALERFLHFLREFLVRVGLGLFRLCLRFGCLGRLGLRRRNGDDGYGFGLLGRWRRGLIAASGEG